MIENTDEFIITEALDNDSKKGLKGVKKQLHSPSGKTQMQIARERTSLEIKQKNKQKMLIQKSAPFYIKETSEGYVSHYQI